MKQYQIEITNRFAALQNLSDGEDINRAWENIKKNIKTSAKESLGMHELKQHRLWLDEECLGFFRSNYGLMKNVQVFQIKESTLKCSC